MARDKSDKNAKKFGRNPFLLEGLSDYSDELYEEQIENEEGVSKLPFFGFSDLVGLVVEESHPFFGKVGVINGYNSITDKYEMIFSTGKRFSNTRIVFMEPSFFEMFYWKNDAYAIPYELHPAAGGPIDLIGSFESLGGTFNELHDEMFRLYGVHFDPTTH